MGAELGLCAKLVKAILIIINILFGILGVIVFAIGIWAIVAESDYSFITGNNIVSGAAILIVCGIITFVICVLGILGALFQARPLLAIYALLVLVIVILEIAAGIVAFVFRDTLVDEIEDRFTEALTLYRFGESDPERDDDVNQAVDSIQGAFECCGIVNASDWFVLNFNATRDNGAFPGCPTCDPAEDEGCVTFNSSTVTDRMPSLSYTTVAEGCTDISSDRFTVFAYAVGAIGIVFGVLEIVGILFALFLCCCITSARKQEVV